MNDWGFEKAVVRFQVFFSVPTISLQPNKGLSNSCIDNSVRQMHKFNHPHPHHIIHEQYASANLATNGKPKLWTAYKDIFNIYNVQILFFFFFIFFPIFL